MNFRVGPFIYRVQQVDGTLEHEGDECLGLCDNEAQVLYVSNRCSETQQVQVLCHEYMEAWLYHFGRADADKEDWCDLFGLAMTQFVLDLMHTLRVQGLTLPPAAAAEGDDAVDRTPAPSRRTGKPDAVRAKRSRPARIAVRATPPLPNGPAEPDGHVDDEEKLRRWRAEVLDKLSRGFAGPSGP